MTDSTEMRALAEKLRQHIVTIIDGEWRLPFSVDDLEEAAAALSALAAERDELDSKLLDSQRWAFCETERADRATRVHAAAASPDYSTG